jgi:hypothetical protein
MEWSLHGLVRQAYLTPVPHFQLTAYRSRLVFRTRCSVSAAGAVASTKVSDNGFRPSTRKFSLLRIHS